MRLRFLQFTGLARSNNDFCSHFTEGFGHLQSESARATRDQSDFAGQIEQFAYLHVALRIMVCMTNNARAEALSAVLEHFTAHIQASSIETLEQLRPLF